MHRGNGKASIGRAGLAAVFRAVALFATALLFAAGQAACAASFTIDPLKVTLDQGRTSAVMRVHNTGSDTLTLQIQPRRWRQERDTERLEPTRELVATPQIFRIRAGATQLVRVALISKADASREIAYRLVFDEIPAPVAADFVGIQVAMRVTIPLFVSPPHVTKSGLKVSVRDAGDGKLAIVAENQGDAHTHLRKFILSSHGDEQSRPVDIETSAYLLPGTTREFIVPRPSGSAASAEKMSIRAIGNTGSVEFDGLAQP